MNKVTRGIAEAIVGILMGIILITMVNSFAQDGMLPKYFVWLFGLFVFIANILTLNTLRIGGLLYAIGWLIGSLWLIDLLGPIDIAFNIAGPIIIIILRLWFLIKREFFS
jgi:hypothetical protein